METESADQTRTLGDLLSEALQGIVFGNGLLILLIAVAFLLMVTLARALKGGSL